VLVAYLQTKDEWDEIAFSERRLFAFVQYYHVMRAEAENNPAPKNWDNAVLEGCLNELRHEGEGAEADVIHDSNWRVDRKVARCLETLEVGPKPVAFFGLGAKPFRALGDESDGAPEGRGLARGEAGFAYVRWDEAELQHLTEVFDEIGGDWPAIAHRLGTGRTAQAVQHKLWELRRDKSGDGARAAAAAKRGNSTRLLEAAELIFALNPGNNAQAPQAKAPKADKVDKHAEKAERNERAPLSRCPRCHARVSADAEDCDQCDFALNMP